MKYYLKYLPSGHIAYCTSTNDNLNFDEHNELDENQHYLEITQSQYEAYKEEDRIALLEKRKPIYNFPDTPIKTAQQIANIQAKKTQKEIVDNKERLKKELIDKQIKVDAIKKLGIDSTKEEAELVKLKGDYEAVKNG